MWDADFFFIFGWKRASQHCHSVCDLASRWTAVCCRYWSKVQWDTCEQQGWLLPGMPAPREIGKKEKRVNFPVFSSQPNTFFKNLFIFQFNVKDSAKIKLQITLLSYIIYSPLVQYCLSLVGWRHSPWGFDWYKSCCFDPQFWFSSVGLSPGPGIRAGTSSLSLITNISAGPGHLFHCFQKHIVCSGPW